MNVEITVLADVLPRQVEEARTQIVLLDRILADASGPARLTLRRSAIVPPHGLVEPA